MKTIVTVLDGTAVGRANLLAACRVAMAYEATVFAAYPVEVPDVLPIDTPMEEVTSVGWPECERAKIVGEEFGVPLQTVVCQAYTIEAAVLGLARDEGADAIALAAPRGRLDWLRWLRGPGPRLVRESVCPVMLIGEDWSPPERYIVAGEGQREFDPLDWVPAPHPGRS